MKKTTRTTLALLIAATAIPMTISSPAFAGPDHKEHAQKADASKMDAKAKKVWDRAIEVGMAKNADEEWIKSVRMTGKMEIPAQGITANMNILMVPETGMRVKMEIPGLGTFSQGVFDDIAWSSDMMSGPRILEGEEAQQFLREMDLYADLNWEEYFTSIKHKGTETVEFPDGTTEEADVLELTAVDSGDVSQRYYSVESGLNIMSSAIAIGPGGSKIPSTTYNTDFREVEGVMMPFKTIASTGPMQQIITFEKVEINGKFEKSELDLPEDVAELVEE